MPTHETIASASDDTATSVAEQVALRGGDFADVTSAAFDTYLVLWDDFIHYIPILLFGVVSLFFTWLVAMIVSRIVRRSLAGRQMRRSLKQLIRQFVFIGVWVLGILITLMVIIPGLTPARMLGGLGIVSLAIGFAFKDIFENFLAGIMLLWQFPFEPGDYIECEGYSGEVEDITIRNTMLILPTNELIILPNSFLFTNPVRVLTHRPHRRITVATGVAYGERLDEAIEVIRETVKQCEQINHKLPIEVVATAFGSSSMDIEVLCFCGATLIEERRARDEIVIAIKRALDDAGIEIPFPYRTLTFKEPLRTLAERAEGDARADA